MVFDTLNNTAIAELLHPTFKTVFDYLKSTNLDSLPLGKTCIEGEPFFILVSEFQGQSKEDVPLESHLQFIDIQLPLQGIESMGWLPVSACHTIEVPYSEKEDYMLFSDKPSHYITIHPGEFIVFFPSDAHAPGLGEGLIKKIVVKVPIQG